MKINIDRLPRLVFAGFLAVAAIMAVSIPSLSAASFRSDDPEEIFTAGSKAEKISLFRGSTEPRLSFLEVLPVNQDKKTAESEKKSETSRPVYKRRFGRAAAEFGLMMTYNQVRYWINYAKYIEDWQFHLSWKDQKTRFFSFEHVRFDSNNFSLNWTHGFAGVLYYSTARTNNLSWPQSFLFSLTGSLWWEYVAEWREVISVNDVIITSVGGYAAGEPWYQLGKYFTGRKGFFNHVMSFVHPMMKLNYWLDRKNGNYPSLGPDPGWHNFRFLTGVVNMPYSSISSSADNRNGVFAGFRSEFIHVPEYGKMGESSRMIKDILSSEYNAEFTLRSGKLEETDFSSRVTGLGYYEQKIGEDKTGYAFSVGMTSAFTLFRKKSVWFLDSDSVTAKTNYDLHLDEPRNFRDKLCVVSIFGPAFDYTSFLPNSRVRFIMDATLDFGLISSFALNKYSENHPVEGMKTTLLYYGYYYGLGTTVRTGLTYSRPEFEFQGLLTYQTYGSLDGRDRFQTEITNDVHAKDSRVTYTLSTAIRIPGTPMEVMGSYEGIDRRGVISEVSHRGLENRFSLLLSYRF